MTDVLVVGGGPVGTFAAAALRARGIEVALWDRGARREHSRAIGVHPPALHALDALGLAEPLVAEAVRVRAGHARRGTRALGTVRFDTVSTRFPFVAALPQHRTEALLAAAAPASDAVTLEAIRTELGAVTAVGRDAADEPVHLRARWIVLATGAGRAAARLAGVSMRERALRDRYVMADLRDDTADGDDAVIGVHPLGVVESFPLPGGVRRVVVGFGATVPLEHAVVVAEAAHRRSGATFDPLTASMVSAFGVHRALATDMMRGRVLLVGDAAHELSPIGGQGMNLGLLDVAELAPLLPGAEPGGAELAAWSRRRVAAAVRAARLAEANMLLGGGMPAPLSAVRDVALAAALRTPSVSRRLARAYAMGGDAGAPRGSGALSR